MHQQHATTTTEHRQLAADLRIIAKAVAQLPDHLYCTVSDRCACVVCHSDTLAEGIRECSRVAGRSGEKYSDDTYLGVRFPLTDRGLEGPIFDVWTNKSSTCERVKVGTKTVKRIVTDTSHEEEFEEDVYEWRCPESLLEVQA